MSHLLSSLSEAEVAALLRLSPSAVSGHAAAVYRHLGVNGRDGLRRWHSAWVVKGNVRPPRIAAEPARLRPSA